MQNFKMNINNIIQYKLEKNRCNALKCIRLFLCVCSFLLTPNIFAHGSFEQHKDDFYAVLAFEVNPEVTKWMRLISSKLMDNHKGAVREEYDGLTFYDYLKSEFPPFKCKHRLLFHWGYNARPWSTQLDKKMAQYRFEATTIKRFQQVLIAEQKYRNGLANAETEKVFGFASSGRDAGYANAFVSILYDVHLLGDYTPDNKDLDGIAPLSSIVGDIVNSLRRIDDIEGRELIKNITAANRRTDIDIQYRAELILNVLADGFNSFIHKAQQGAIVSRLKKKGIYFRKIDAYTF